MKLFSVSYDLLKPGKDYSGLARALESLGAKRILLSEWVLRGNYTAIDLRDKLKNYIDSNDRLVVKQVTDWASYNALVDINKAA